jgi:hypothetical protein
MHHHRAFLLATRQRPTRLRLDEAVMWRRMKVGAAVVAGMLVIDGVLAVLNRESPWPLVVAGLAGARVGGGLIVGMITQVRPGSEEDS